jgi:hypothetical protein
VRAEKRREFVGRHLTDMFSMRTLLSSDPFLPREVREAVGGASDTALEELVRLGVNYCEASELLDCGDERSLEPHEDFMCAF